MFGGRIIVYGATAVVAAGWQMTAPALTTVVFGLFLGHVYITAQLPVKRLMSNAKAPIIGHIQNALIGLGCHLDVISRKIIIDFKHSFGKSVWSFRHVPEGASRKI